MSETAQYRAELLARLRNATDDLAWAVRGVTDAAAHYKPSPQEWSIHEHLSHFRDMEEQVYLPLLRWATVPDMLEPKEYSRHAWHQQRYRPDEPLRSILDDLLRMRDEELTIFRQLTDYDWTRYRTDTRWGPLTCQWIAGVMYRHTLDHLQCIMGLLQDLHLAALAPGSAVVGGYIGGEEGR